MRSTILILTLTLLLTACGDSGNTNTPAGSNSTGTKPATANSPASSSAPASGSGIEVTVKGKTHKLDPKSAFIFSEDLTINMPDGKSIPTSSRYLVAANYDLDTTFGRSTTGKPIASADGVRIMVSFQDKAEVKKDAPPSVGFYEGGKVANFENIVNIQVFTMEGGAQPVMKVMGSMTENKGGIKITAVNGDTVTGELDFSNSEGTIKGPFTAKIWKQGGK